MKRMVLVVWWLCAGVAGAREGGVGKPQPRDSSGLPLTLTVVNPATDADATLFRQLGRGRREPMGIVRRGTRLAVTTLPGERFVVFYPCGNRSLSHRVPRWLADEWKLPARPCR